MKLKELTLKDRPVFEKYLRLQCRQLSIYSFAGIFVCSPLYKILWQVMDGNLCVFFRDKIGCFMNLEPAGKIRNLQVVKKCFEIMDTYNKNHSVSRIENIEGEALDFYRKCGYNCVYKTSEYLCSRQKLSELKGDAFKSRRSEYNYFIKNYPGRYSPLISKEKNSCLLLYRQWMNERKLNYNDSLYAGMLKDNFLSQRVALNNYLKLGILARTIKLNKKISAYTLGYKLNKDTFCILSETADLSIKGLPQYIFREFAKELSGYKYINIMDDLGLESLAKVKLSYRPVRLVPAYNIERYA